MSLLEVTDAELDPPHRAQAVELFLADVGRLRAWAPHMPCALGDGEAVAARVGELLDARRSLAVIRDGRLIGYLGWHVLDDFRGTGQRAALCPAWGHAVHGDDPELLYQALYRAASRRWAEAGCQIHALTVLAHDDAAVRAFFHNGFGLAVVDAIRAIDVPGRSDRAAGDHKGSAAGERGLPAGAVVRKATADDLEALVGLEAEFRQHFTEAPVLMAPSPPPGPERIRAALTDQIAGYWLALDDDRPVGFVRCEPTPYGASPIVAAETTIGISGAFVQAEHRGRGLASALVDAALASYARSGFTHCSVDFESFNPEARAFWLRTFTPICLSVIRRPEAPTSQYGDSRRAIPADATGR